DAVLPALASTATVVDLCAGSGALAVAIAHEVPGARVYAVERSPAALPWLHRNAAAPGVIVVEGAVTDPALLAELSGRVDAGGSKRRSARAATSGGAGGAAAPADAIFAGADGLAVIPAVIARAAALLRPGGVLAIEHDESHGGTVPVLLADGWREVADHPDLT